MSLQSLSLKEIFVNISNAFVGTIADMGNPPDDEIEHDKILRILMKENRYMYLTLLFLLLLIIGNLVYST
jgi:hypothetical protein